MRGYKTTACPASLIVHLREKVMGIVWP